jgi:hypothetical protein
MLQESAEGARLTGTVSEEPVNSVKVTTFDASVMSLSAYAEIRDIVHAAEASATTVAGGGVA